MTRLDIISDFVCPWCYLGKVNLEAAIAARGAHPFAITWHAFQLDPTIPPEGHARGPYIEAKLGGPEQAAAAHARLTEMGAAAGIAFRFDRITRAPNTLDAHRLTRWAAAEDRQTLVATELFRRYFEEGEDISDPGVLTAAAEAAGLDPAPVARLLAGEADRAEVAAEVAEAARIGVTGVPTFILGGRYAVNGAQPPEVWARVMDELDAATA
ncbi:DsbA family oxidoreductase [Amaricoccus solimangrovi]|uniref:DsbA family oxidoreductase n=1 Tax=Amaricoccus solimangrovi TaxID=2589815 RepID=A0A501WPI7_9RHOB|nr:DsbA family oxidoreductase [Amaricoccus solimangrovi]TPE51359.1 DsbA family oxidoreductase [Amaricoccus solimangrovi]